MEIDRRESGRWNGDAVIRRPALQIVTAATGWSEGHALRPKRVADDPSFESSRDPLVEGPQSPRGDCPERMPLAVWLLVQSDLGVHNASYAREQQVDAPAVGVPARRLVRKHLGCGRLAAPSQGASPSPTHSSYTTTGLRLARDGHRTSLLTGAAPLFATPPPAANRPLQTRHTSSCP
jgi:hypothetical protein